jgi:hypothetical protein
MPTETKIRRYQMGDFVIEYNPEKSAKQKRIGRINKLRRQIHCTRKTHFNGVPPNPHAINIALWKIGSSTRIDEQPAFRVAHGSGIAAVPTTNVFGKTDLRKWILDALQAEETSVKDG